MRSTKSTDLIGHIRFLSWGQLNGCSVVRPFLFLWRVWLARPVDAMSLGEHHFTGSNPLSEFHSAHTIHLTSYYGLLWQPVWLYHVNIKWHVPLAIPLITSLVPRPRPAFCHLQYGKAGRAWYLFSRDHDVIGKLQKFAKLTGWVSRIFNRLRAQRSVCKTIASR